MPDPASGGWATADPTLEWAPADEADARALVRRARRSLALAVLNLLFALFFAAALLADPFDVPILWLLVWLPLWGAILLTLRFGAAWWRGRKGPHPRVLLARGPRTRRLGGRLLIGELELWLGVLQARRAADWPLDELRVMPLGGLRSRFGPVLVLLPTPSRRSRVLAGSARLRGRPPVAAAPAPLRGAALARGSQPLALLSATLLLGLLFGYALQEVERRGQDLSSLSQTDPDGVASFADGGVDRLVRFVDGASGDPIPGLVTVLVRAAAYDGAGLLLIHDPTGWYPTQFALVAPPPGGASGGAVLDVLLPVARAAGDGQPPTVPVQRSEYQSIDETDFDPDRLTRFLDWVSWKLVPVYIRESLELGAKAMAQSGLVDPARWASRPPVQVTSEQALAEINQRLAEHWAAAFLRPALPGLATVVTLSEALLTLSLDAGTVHGCTLAPGEAGILRHEVGPLVIYSCQAPVEITQPVFPVRARINGTQGPARGRLHSLDLLGVNYVCGFEAPDTCSVPRGQYAGRVESGDRADLVPLRVDEQGGHIEADLQPAPAGRITLTSQPGLTGFLEPGDRVQFTATATYEDGTPYPCIPIYFVSNPVGPSVASIEASTGLLTIGEGDGAARVVARCGPLTSEPTLVSARGGPAASATPGPTDSGSTPPPPCETPWEGLWQGQATIQYEYMVKENDEWTKRQEQGSFGFTIRADCPVPGETGQNWTEHDVVKGSATDPYFSCAAECDATGYFWPGNLAGTPSGDPYVDYALYVRFPNGAFVQITGEIQRSADGRSFGGTDDDSTLGHLVLATNFEAEETLLDTWAPDGEGVIPQQTGSSFTLTRA